MLGGHTSTIPLGIDLSTPKLLEQLEKTWLGPVASAHMEASDWKCRSMPCSEDVSLFVFIYSFRLLMLKLKNPTGSFP